MKLFSPKLLFFSAFILTYACKKNALPSGTQVPRNLADIENIKTDPSITQDFVTIDGVTPSSALTTYGCGSTFSGTYSGTGFHTYPDATMDVTTSPDNASVEVDVSAVSVPNKFVVYDGTTILAQSNWLGSATYSGPWGSSLHARPDTSLFFHKVSGKTYTVRVQTQTQSNTDSWTAGIACNYPVPSITDFTSTSVTQTVTSAFNNLEVNYATLGSAIGLGHTLAASDIDFVHLTKTRNSTSADSSYAICAPFVSNSSSNPTNYAFVLFKVGNVYGSPMIIKSTFHQDIKYFPVSGLGIVTSVNNYESTTPTITSSSGGYMRSTSGGCGQDTIDCVLELYSKRGWGSLYLWVFTNKVPIVGAIAAIGCAAINCIHR